MNYAREVKDPSMMSYLINSTGRRSRNVPPINFSPEDTTRGHYPHCNSLVVQAIVARNGLRRILVDNGSSVNILFGTTFNKMMVDHELTPMTAPLYSFTSDNIVPRGRITLAVEMGEQSFKAHHFMKFLIVDYDLLTMEYLDNPP
ncbi:unnamed protein product [Fraxinus pennsylvanica]|uniref:Uncharacterized protein n=1 Tax=Fraxinus pennsylvanica TaxID=56036 RepID=A0AAD1ZBY4_9LAMI|nr:unnamed protein product [Fraxinus pennsylvanica]